MDVDLRPPMHGCLIALVSVWTFGFYPFMRRIGERRFIRSMDDAGILTRGGRRIPWDAVTSVRQVESQMRGVKLSDELLLESTAGKASLPMWRTRNPDELKEYLVRRLPPGVRVIRAARVSYR